jgi:(1->4)-alpha-D-glucan 1-alpha-D-glucosylmutase
MMTGPNLEGVSPQALREQAARRGIATEFTSFWGQTTEVPAPVLASALRAMGPQEADPADEPVVLQAGVPQSLPLGADGPWTLRRDDGSDRVLVHGQGTHAELPGTLEPGYYLLQTAAAGPRFVIVAPAQCWAPAPLHNGERWWGIATQLYALRSERNWGIGDFTDLAALAATAAQAGAAFVGISPVHALRPGQPEAASPYSPSNRLALNTLHIDVTAVPGFAACSAVQSLLADPVFQERLRKVRGSTTVLYQEVADLKQAVIAPLWEMFCVQAWKAGTDDGRAFDAFMAAHQDTLGLHARYEALQQHLNAADPAVWGWPAWPAALQDPASPEVAEFARLHPDEIAFHYWLQWLAHTQLARASAHARQVMPLGLYGDLAVGAVDGGAESWTFAGLYARGMNVGAPPDPLSAQGQDWGLPPVNPVRLRATRFRQFRALLTASMRHCGALRLDHVMALMRLYWNSPDGGTYVGYPLQAMLAIVAVESHRFRCLVIGEDLGNVAPLMREAMEARGLLSYRPLIFERLESGGIRPPAEWKTRALAVVSTHDLPTLRGFWAADDIATQQSLGWLPGTDDQVRAQLARAHDRTHLLAALQAQHMLPEGVTLDARTAPDMTPELAAAVYAFLAQTSCQLVAATMEDLTGQREQPNVPGTSESMFPNWRRRNRTPIEALGQDPWFCAISRAIRVGRSAWLHDAPQPLPDLGSADVPLSTYRVQLHAGFTFEQARAAVPYLHRLGISHLYTAPYLNAAPGSLHGYDVVDPTQLNPEIGTDADHAALCEALTGHGMGHLLDFVPNHMGVEHPSNLWWQDMLEHGEASVHAAKFDIEWCPANPQTGRRVLLPVLGEHYGKVLEAGQLRVDGDEAAGRLQVHYFDHVFPLDPRSYGLVLRAAPLPGDASGPGHSTAEAASLVDALAALPDRFATDPDLRAARLRDSAIGQRRLAELVAAHTWARDWLRACLARVNGEVSDSGDPADPARFDLLDELLQSQTWRLADWRVAGDDINYRRFFNINSLAALRMEDPEVFEATHVLPMRWLGEGKLTGLRIDHPDGLAHPSQYFQRLQQRYAALQRAQGKEPRALYLVVEKIMADHEPLPADWPVHGGTGYRFSTLVTGVMVDTAAQARFDAMYQAFTGEDLPFEEAAYECKRLIIESVLFSDMTWLMDTLHRITRADRAVCDFTRNQLRIALVEVAAQFPVYRTYVLADGTPPSDLDRQHIAWAIKAARRKLGTAEGGVLAYIHAVLLGTPGPEPALRHAFVRRWQQFTAPVMAKAIEDTLFYRYTRLVSLNDVGAEPRRFGVSVAAFHQTNSQRSRHVPHGLLATSTHDSKRSEDVRARLNVLSDLPEVWQAVVEQLQAAGHSFCSEVDGQQVPTAGDLWSLYQTMVGIWPARPVDAAEKAALSERLQQYKIKAMREAKVATNWLFPHEAYEAAVTRYIGHCLASRRFVGVLEDFVQRIAPCGYRNSLCQVALKLTCPGVPDIYQGCEVWNFSLVDPDNRRPVDLHAMAQSLDRVQALYARGYPAPAAWQELLGSGPDMPSDVKQLVTWRLLQLRSSFAALFRNSIYLPLEITGDSEAHALAFARILDDQVVVLVSSRLLASKPNAGWGDTRVALARAHPGLVRVQAWTNWMTGRTLVAKDALTLDEVLGNAMPGGDGLPFAVLVPADALI